MQSVGTISGVRPEGLALLDNDSASNQAGTVVARTVPGELGGNAPTTPVRPPSHPSPKVPPLPPPQGGGGTPASVLLRGFAVGLGAWIGWNLPDWIDKLVNGNRTFVIDEGRCEVKDYADNFLRNLRDEGKNVAMRSLPPTEYSWSLPNGYGFTVRQHSGKYGLEISGEFKTPSGEKYPFKFTSKGGTFRIFDTAWVAGGETFGRLTVDLRIGPKGVDEAAFQFTSHNGYVTTFKLKPKPCDLDATTAALAQFNAGQPEEARRLAHEHLLATARSNGGDITPGLFDLLTKIRPGPDGMYRNHGSQALDSVVRPLNALLRAGVDLGEFQRLQATGSRAQVVGWFQNALAEAIRTGKVSPTEVANVFGLNLGVQSLAGLRLPRSTASASTESTNVAPTVQQLRVMPDKVREQLAQRGIVVPFATQTRDGRLFVPITPDNPRFDSALDSTANVLRVDADRLWWHEATLNNFRGVVIEPRQYPLSSGGTNLSATGAVDQRVVDGQLIVGEPARISTVGGRNRATGVLLQGDLMWGRTRSGEIVFWLQGRGTNYLLRSAADGTPITNQVDAENRAREMIGNGAATDLRPLDPRYVR